MHTVVRLYAYIFRICRIYERFRTDYTDCLIILSRITRDQRTVYARRLCCNLPTVLVIKRFCYERKYFRSRFLANRSGPLLSAYQRSEIFSSYRIPISAFEYALGQSFSARYSSASFKKRTAVFYWPQRRSLSSAAAANEILIINKKAAIFLNIPDNSCRTISFVIFFFSAVFHDPVLPAAHASPRCIQYSAPAFPVPARQVSYHGQKQAISSPPSHRQCVSYRLRQFQFRHRALGSVCTEAVSGAAAGAASLS